MNVKSFKVLAYTGVFGGALLMASAALAAKSKKISPTDLLKDHAPEMARQYQSFVFNSYDNLAKKSEELQSRVKTFILNPDQETHAAAKEAWKAARLAYSPTEAFRFYAGPIDAPEKNLEPLMNAWPIDESFIDATKDSALSGIINNPEKYPIITRDSLQGLNMKDGERNVSTGYHAVEFLLWGQDFYRDTAGRRSPDEFLPERSPNAERRGQYLMAATDLLVDQARSLVEAWRPESVYVNAFKKEAPEEILRRILTGATSLASDEMAGERMTVALERNDQENEQDCFSDFSLDDLIANQQGIISTYNESGVKTLFSKQDKRLEQKITKELDTALEALKKIRPPFDRILSDKKNREKKTVQRAIEALQKQSQSFSKMAGKFNVHLNVQ